MSLTFVTKPQGGTPRGVSGWGMRSIGDGKWVGGGEYDGDGGVHGVSDGSVDGERPEPAHPSAVATTIAINTAAPSLRTAESLEPDGPLPLSRGSGSPKPGWEIVEGCSICHHHYLIHTCECPQTAVSGRQRSVRNRRTARRRITDIGDDRPLTRDLQDLSRGIR